MKKSVVYVIKIAISLTAILIFVRVFFGEYDVVSEIGSSGAVRSIGENVMLPISEVYNFNCRYFKIESTFDWSTTNIATQFQYFDN